MPNDMLQGKMKILNATEILDKISYGNYEDYEIYPKTTYKCSKCDEVVTFCFKDFDKHSFSKHTNLTEKEALEIEETVKGGEFNGSNSFLDFHCPRCNRPYQAWAGGRHGEAGHEIQYIIE
ncbi:MAG: hypothetical protein C4519_21755 [Desulfobacteraceae bacterium]|nr:MAG: hypothetical protein C4519_21755 [Desulfobacteraceae bacterium]